MSATLAYSREHTCHNQPMIWQPAAQSFYCPVRKCHRREAPNEYGAAAVMAKDFVDSPGEMEDQPIPA